MVFQGILKNSGKLLPGFGTENNLRGWVMKRISEGVDWDLNLLVLKAFGIPPVLLRIHHKVREVAEVPTSDVG